MRVQVEVARSTLGITPDGHLVWVAREHLTAAEITETPARSPGLERGKQVTARAGRPPPPGCSISERRALQPAGAREATCDHPGMVATRRRLAVAVVATATLAAGCGSVGSGTLASMSARSQPAPTTGGTTPGPSGGSGAQTILTPGPTGGRLIPRR